MENSHISWTDHTFNPWEGCTKVSPGCANCYAETRNKRFSGGANWGKGAPRRRTGVSNWQTPLKWNLRAGANASADWYDGKCLERPRVFCASLADWLDDEVPIEWLGDLLGLITQTPYLDWLLLTKRPENWLKRMIKLCDRLPFANRSTMQSVVDWRDGLPFANVWVGATVEDEARKWRMDVLRSIPARVHFLSCEPLLGDLGELNLKDIEWVIVGGESGKDARPMHPDWARSIRNQCNAAKVPFHFKQWGEWTWDINNPFGTGYPDKDKYCFHDPACTMLRVGKFAAGRLLDGIEHNGFPSLILPQPAQR